MTARWSRASSPLPAACSAAPMSFLPALDVEPPLTEPMWHRRDATVTKEWQGVRLDMSGSHGPDSGSRDATLHLLSALQRVRHVSVRVYRADGRLVSEHDVPTS